MKKVDDGTASRAELTRFRKLMREQQLKQTRNVPVESRPNARAVLSDGFEPSQAAAAPTHDAAESPVWGQQSAIDFHEPDPQSRPAALKRLSQLIREKGGVVSERDIQSETRKLADDAASGLRAVYLELQALKQRGKLDPVRKGETVTEGLVVRLAAQDLQAQDERRINQVACIELLRLFQTPGKDDIFHRLVGRQLTRVHHVDADALSAAETKPKLKVLEEDRRRAHALAAVLLSGEGKLKEELGLNLSFKLACIQRLGQCGDKGSLAVLEKVAAAEPGSKVAVAAEQSAAAIRQALKMTIVIAALEADPFCRVAGLGMVMGREPQALSRLGHDVSAIIPGHGFIDNAKYGFVDSRLGPEADGSFSMETPDGVRGFRLLAAEYKGVTYYQVHDFVELPREPLFSNRRGVYKDPETGPFGDDLQRFDFFSRAVVMATKALEKQKGGVDVLVCSDSHTGLVPQYLKLEGPTRTKTLSVIHNLAHQNTFEMSARDQLWLGREPSLDALFGPMGNLEFFGKINLFKAGLTAADGVSTVSEVYRDETLQHQMQGAGLGGVLAQKAALGTYWGAMNGFDIDEWDPSTDVHLVKWGKVAGEDLTYEAGDLAGKHRCKKQLLQEYALASEGGQKGHHGGFDSRESLPLVSFSGRIDHQKGIDAVIELIEHSMTQGPRAQFIICGDAANGDPELVEKLIALASAKENAGFVVYDPHFKPVKEHKLLAASDFFLMPSTFEPCGQPQLYAMAMGTVPLVRATGGLDESVVSYDPTLKTGNGGKFRDDPRPMFDELIGYYQQGGAVFRQLVRNNFLAVREHSWDSAAEERAAAFRRLTHTEPRS